MADPKASERLQIQAWKPVQYGGYARGNWELDFDGEDFEASVNVSGYGGYGDRVYMPVDLIRVLLSAHGLRIVKVLEARDTCWHGLDCLEPITPRCERCPAECDDETCTAEGCVVLRAELAHRGVKP